MAIVSLLGNPKEKLFSIIAKENPGIVPFPLDWYMLSEPKVQHERRTWITLIGDAGTRADARLSGALNVFYNRVDLDQLTQKQKPLQVHGATTKHALLLFMARQWGIEISPDLVVDGPLDTEATSVTLTFQDHKYLLLQDSITFPMHWSSTVDLATILTSQRLDGFDPPWPYPQVLTDVLPTKQLNGFAAPQIFMYMPEISKYWCVDDLAVSAWLAGRTVDGPYSPNLLVQAVSLASRGDYPWQCVDDESTKFNLWASTIVANEPSTGVISSLYNRTLRIRPHSTYFREGIGEISIHYRTEG